MAVATKKNRVVKGIEHGLSGYTNYQCRCDTCREANRQHSADYRSKRFAGTPLCVRKRCPHPQSRSYGNGLCYKHARKSIVIRRQLNAMDRKQLKRLIEKRGLRVKVLRKHTTDQIRDRIQKALGYPIPTRPLRDE